MRGKHFFGTLAEWTPLKRCKHGVWCVWWWKYSSFFGLPFVYFWQPLLL